MPKLKPKKPGKPGTATSILVFSGLTVEMAVMIAFGAYAGNLLDKRFHTSKPYFTAFLSLLFVALALYSAYVQIKIWQRKKS